VNITDLTNFGAEIALMHIAVLCDPASFHTQKWTRAIAATGTKVTIFSFSDYKLSDIPCVRILPAFTLKGHITYASYLFTTKALYKTLKAHQVDILNPLNITPFGVWAARSGFRPIVSTAMGADILEYPPTKKNLSFPKQRRWERTESETKYSSVIEKIKWPIFRYLVQTTLNQSDLITADNLILVEAIQNWFGTSPDKVVLNRWGIEPDLFDALPSKLESIRRKYNLKPEKRLILSPRGMKPIYQGDIILKAFEKLLQDENCDAQYMMLSAGYEVPRSLHHRAQRLADQYNNFHYVSEQIPRHEMMMLWRLVYAFVSAPVYDGQSNALNEGRYVGAIPIVNDIPANRELITHQVNGWIVKPFTAKQLAQDIHLLCNSEPTYQQKFAQANEKWIQDHAMLAQNMSQFIQDCSRILQRQKHK